MKKATTISLIAVSALFLLSVSACGSSSNSNATSSGSGNNSSAGSSSSAAASAVKLIHPGKLTICTNPPFAPFETLQGTKFTGLDIDVMDNVAKALGVTVAPINTPFEQIESGVALTANNCDILASALSITTSRASKYNFSYPYFNNVLGVLTKEPSITDVASLKGKKIVVQRVTTGANWVKAKGLPYVETPDLGTQIQGLKSGQTDVAINDDIVLEPYATDGYRIAFIIPDNGQYGYGVSKSNPALLQVVNTTLRTMTSDGTMASLYKKYSIPADSLVAYDTSGNPVITTLNPDAE